MITRQTDLTALQDQLLEKANKMHALSRDTAVESPIDQYVAGLKFAADRLTAALGSLPVPEMVRPVLYIQRANGQYEVIPGWMRQTWAERQPSGLTRYDCDCLNAAKDGTPTDDNGVYCERWVYLAEDVDAKLSALLSRSAQEPPTAPTLRALARKIVDHVRDIDEHGQSEGLSVEDVIELALTDAVSRSRAPQESNSAWLVELGSNPPQWWTGRIKGCQPFSYSANDAMRFARREDAEGAIGHLVKDGVADGCKATEHSWSMASVASPPAPEGEKTVILSDGRCTICGTIVQPNCVHSCAGSEPNSSLPHTHYSSPSQSSQLFTCSRCLELQRTVDRLSEANRRLQAEGPALERDKLIVELRAALALQAQPWQPMETALKDGTPILIDFSRHGVHRVFWYEEPFSVGIGAWCVTDLKYEDRPLRRYIDDDMRGWMPLPAPQTASLPSAAAPVKENSK